MVKISKKTAFINLQIKMQERFLKKHTALLKQLVEPLCDEVQPPLLPKSLMTKDEANREYLGINEVVLLLKEMKEHDLSVRQVRGMIRNQPIASLYVPGTNQLRAEY